MEVPEPGIEVEVGGLVEWRYLSQQLRLRQEDLWDGGTYSKPGVEVEVGGLLGWRNLS